MALQPILEASLNICGVDNSVDLENEVDPRRVFGDHVRRLREAQQKKMRGFAKLIGLDPSQYSKIERGHLAPPGRETVAAICHALGIRPSHEDWLVLHDLADIGRGALPLDLLSNRLFLAALPKFLALVRANPLVGADAMYQAFNMVRLGFTPQSPVRRGPGCGSLAQFQEVTLDDGLGHMFRHR